MIWRDAKDSTSRCAIGSDPLPTSTATQTNESMRHILWLRVCQNKILNELYTASKAYCHPSTIGNSVSQISLLLEDWYRSLPLEMQFSRNIPRLRTGSASEGPILVRILKPNRSDMLTSRPGRIGAAILYLYLLTQPTRVLLRSTRRFRKNCIPY